MLCFVCFESEETLLTAEVTDHQELQRPVKMELEQIKQIYDYTKFHIGLYFTLLTGLIAFVNFGRGEHVGERHQPVLLVIIFVLLVGGIAGALVASRIVYGPWTKECFDIGASEFWKKRRFGHGRAERDGGLGQTCH
jgi:hypothetical protein